MCDRGSSLVQYLRSWATVGGSLIPRPSHVLNGLGNEAKLGVQILPARPCCCNLELASHFIPIAPATVPIAVKYGPGFGWGGKQGQNIHGTPLTVP